MLLFEYFYSESWYFLFSFFFSANPLGILSASLLSPYLMKSADDMPLLVSGSSFHYSD